MAVITPLHGHNSQEKAYIIESYPYGRLRCKKKVWVELAEKGAGKGLVRIAEQTSNPKRNNEVWNKPHYGTYQAHVFMYLNEDNHVKYGVLGKYTWPETLETYIKDFWQYMNTEEKTALRAVWGETCKFAGNNNEYQMNFLENVVETLEKQKI